MKTITIKKNSKMKTVKLTKKQVEACGWQCETKRDAKADQITKKLAKLETIREKCQEIDPRLRDAVNGRKWKVATLELYDLLDELSATDLDVCEDEHGNYGVWLPKATDEMRKRIQMKK